MKITFKNRKFSRSFNSLIAVAFLVAVILPLMGGGLVHAAYGQVQSRSIQLSDSNGGDTGVSYLVQFNVATTGTIQGYVVDFCSNDPIITDSCTLPTGFTVGGSPTFTPGTNTASGWTASSANSGRTFELINSSGGSISSGATVSFTITAVANPTAENTTFYARIFTFATSTGPASWVTASSTGNSITGVIDAGGIAMSTAQNITVTAKVQEQITFCVFTNAAANCGAASGSSVILGDTHGVLSSAGPFVDKNTQYIIATNASHGAVIDIKAAATLTSGSNYIAAINGGSATPAASAYGTSQFGLCSYGTGITVATTYAGGGNCSSTTQTAGTGGTGGIGTATFGFNTTNLPSTYGDQLASVAAASATTGTVAFLGNIIVTQPAGIYTALITFIATGTY